MSKRHWWVLRVIPQKEVETEKLIKRFDGYEAMVPYVEGRRRVHKTPRPWKFPLFPGYVFASWENWSEGWNRVSHRNTGIAWVYDFLKPVWWGSDPSILKPGDVEYLRSIADGKFKSEDQRASVQVGDWVLIPDGSFQGCIGTVKEISGKSATVEVPEVKMTSNIKIRLAKLEKV
jgi:transcription antitermination factor NusG